MTETKSLTEDIYFVDFVEKNIGFFYSLNADHILDKVNIKDGTIIIISRGDCLLAIELAKRMASKIKLVEPSEEMIIRSKEKIKKMNLHDNIEIQKWDRHSLNFPDNFADLVITTDLLSQWVSPLSTFMAIYKILKAGGYLYIRDNRRDAPKIAIDKISRKLPKRIADAIKLSVKESYTIEELKGILKKTNFREYEIIEGYSKKVLMRHIISLFKSPIADASFSKLSLQMLIKK